MSKIKFKILVEIIKFKLFILDWKMDIAIEDTIRLFLTTKMLNLSDFPKELQNRFIKKSLLKLRLRILTRANNINQLVVPIKQHVSEEILKENGFS